MPLDETLFEGDIVPPKTQQTLFTVSGLARRPTGALAESFPRHSSTISAQTITTANATYTAVALTKGTVVTHMDFWSGSTALATGTHALAGLYSSALAKLATSADGTSTAWAANTKRTFDMTTPYVVLADDIFYVALAIAATTTPSVAGVSTIAVVAEAAPSVGFVDSTNTISTALPATATNSAGAAPLYVVIR